MSTTLPPIDTAAGAIGIPSQAESFRPVRTIVFFTLLAIVHTWPLATDPGHLSRNDNADTQLNEWIVSWVAHRLPTDPRHLFNANIFHPEPRTLAFSEPLIVPGIMAMPLRAFGASPVLTYNLLLLLGLVLCGVAMSAVITSWMGDRWAGLLAGTLFAFNPQTMTRLPHLQALHGEWLPLAVWALDAILISRRTRYAYGLALFVTLLCLTSGYLAIFTAFALAAAFIVRCPEWLGAGFRQVVPRVALATVITLGVVVPILWPYAVVHRSQGLTRQLQTVKTYSVMPRNYLVSSSNLHYDLWSRSVRRTIRGLKTSLVPGVVGLAASGCALWLCNCRGRLCPVVGNEHAGLRSGVSALRAAGRDSRSRPMGKPGPLRRRGPRWAGPRRSQTTH
jgi:hypothetical protein